MRVSEAKDLFRQLTRSFFKGATVVFSQQSRAAKTTLPLVVIAPGNVNRPQNPTYKVIDGVLVGNYLSRLSITVDLFTNGAPVVDDETGKIVAYENTALDDMLGFSDFLGSQSTIEWSHSHDVTVLVEGDALDMTGLVNDNNYEFRSRLNIMFYFTQRTVGDASVLSEDSILYPKGNPPVYTPEEPVQSSSSTGTFSGITEDDPPPIIDPVYKESSSGGGSEDLANQETGYFVEVEIKEETGNE